VDCYSVYHRSERVQPRVRQSREMAVRRYRARRRGLALGLTFILTGAGHLLAGRALRGAFFLLCFLTFAGLGLAWNGILRPVAPATLDPDLGRMVAAALVFGVVYLLAILDIRVEEAS